MTEAIFIPEGTMFVPTKVAASPWAERFQHGGPPAGLLTRAIERHAPDPELQLARLTVDLFRPVPMAPLEVRAHTVREGKRIHVVEAGLFADGVEVARAVGLLLRTSDHPNVTAVRLEPPPGPEGMSTGFGPSDLARRSEPMREGFHTLCEFRRIPPSTESAAAAAWVRIPLPLVAGEAISPAVRVAATADFINAIGGGGRGAWFPTINTDSTVYLHRPAAGEWLCLLVERAIDPAGIGVSAAVIFDREGAIGRGAQAVLANEMR